MLRRHVDGPEHAGQRTAFQAVVQLVVPVHKRSRAAGHQDHRLIPRQHAARDQPLGERAGVARRCRAFDLPKTGSQLLVLLGGYQSAVR
jgi:hypothetical protein